MRSRRLLEEARAAERKAVDLRIKAEKDATTFSNACARLAEQHTHLREVVAGLIVAARTPANAGASAAQMADTLADTLRAEGFDLRLEFAEIDRRRAARTPVPAAAADGPRVARGSSAPAPPSPGATP
ncbi:hypothetical protein GCM10010400_58100 [Streptomyces aculeolatus]|uniref:hypothetical protein n=1 Tax=Streptomyces aculeolatus TaxID=270689 RepID=UPI001CECFCC2|nr:hypothetical protein [Streptomyces aculeolatus]